MDGERLATETERHIIYAAYMQYLSDLQEIQYIDRMVINEFVHVIGCRSELSRSELKGLVRDYYVVDESKFMFTVLRHATNKR